MSSVVWMAAVMVAASAAFWAGVSEARTDGLSLAQRKVCLGCHQVATRRVGPPFKSIAERYAQGDDRDASIEYLMTSIQQGSRGKWGAIGMPAQPQVSEREARVLAEWLLDLAP